MITTEQAQRWSDRAGRAYQKMLRATNQERRNLYARAWARAIDRICDYKRERQADEAAR